MTNLESVRVALRVRPLVPSEEARGCQVAVERRGEENQVSVNNTNAFTFNYVFDGRDTQERVYNVSVSALLDKLFNGFNATILAYGQTGSGKTHTMGTAFDGALDANVGVIPRAMHDIFERAKRLSNEFDFIIKCSFMELYQEQLYDLLSDKSREDCVINMREDRNGIVLGGLIEKEVHTAIETTECLVQGSTRRAVASTAMNTASSRSHAIFTVTLQATKKDESHAITTTKFQLVDLAGSERSKKTGATGNRFKEGVKINQGLLALGNVISALGNGKDSSFVRYRDSKLTRLLQDSLGGNSVTLMIACVSPADYNVPETLSTLRYADRARKIKNKPIVNEDPHAAEINRLKGIIQTLRLELENKDASKTVTVPNHVENVGFIAPLESSTMSSKEQNSKYLDLLEKYKSQQQLLQMTLQDAATFKTRVLKAHGHIKHKAEEMRCMVSELLKINGGLLDAKKLDDTVGNINKLLDGLDEELSRVDKEVMDEKQCSSASVENKDDIGEKLKECQHKMQALEAERTHVNENASIKLANKRRLRLQALELEMVKMKQKSTQQDKQLKLREKDAEKIKNLSVEIQSMKETKVKLMKAVRSETEHFRQFKIIHEKQLMQLKTVDRNMQNEIARKDAFQSLQCKVLKRKCEEALALNKRLKDALEKQKVAETQGQKMQSLKDATAVAIKIEKVIVGFERELEKSSRRTTKATNCIIRTPNTSRFEGRNDRCRPPAESVR